MKNAVVSDVAFAICIVVYLIGIAAWWPMALLTFTQSMTVSATAAWAWAVAYPILGSFGLRRRFDWRIEAILYACGALGLLFLWSVSLGYGFP